MVLSASLGLLGTLGSSIASGVMAGHGQYRAYQYNRKLQKQQYDLQQKGYREGPTNARQGMEKAGYNPILAVGSGLGSGFAGAGNAGGVGAISGDVGDFASSASNAYRAFKLEKQQADNQSLIAMTSANSNNAQADLNREQALTEQAKRTQMDFQNAMLDVEKHLKQKELSWADRKFYSEIYDNMQRAENYGAIQAIERYNAQTARENAKTNAMNAITNELNGRNSRRYNQVNADISGQYLELNKLKAPFEMSRDTLLPLATYGLSSKYSSNAQQFGNRERYDYYYDGFPTRSHR